MKGFFKNKSLGLMGLGNSARTPLDQKKIKKKKGNQLRSINQSVRNTDKSDPYKFSEKSFKIRQNEFSLA
jgi:hypothetical protein